VDVTTVVVDPESTVVNEVPELAVTISVSVETGMVLVVAGWTVMRTEDVITACEVEVVVEVTATDGEALPMTALHALERMVGPNGIKLAGVTTGPTGG